MRLIHSTRTKAWGKARAANRDSGPQLEPVQAKVKTKSGMHPNLIARVQAPDKPEKGEPGTAAGAERAGNKSGNVTEHNRQGAGAGNKAAGAGNAGANGNKVKTANQRTAGAGNGGANSNKAKTGNQGNNMRTTGGNQAKMHTSKGAGAGGAAHAAHPTNQVSHQPKAVARNPQMSAHNAQMGAKHPPTAGGGNRPAPKGQPQGKKKPGER